MARPIGVSPQKRTDTFEGMVGAVVTQYRVNKGFSQLALAEKVDCDISYISQLERGLISPSLRRILEIAAALELDPATLKRSIEHGRMKSKPNKR